MRVFFIVHTALCIPRVLRISFNFEGVISELDDDPSSLLIADNDRLLFMLLSLFIDRVISLDLLDRDDRDYISILFKFHN